MFNNNVEDEADFCEAYKSQILNVNSEEKESSFTSILTILLLLVIIIALSIYGYNYFTDSEKTQVKSVQMIDDEELKVQGEEELPVSPMVEKEPVAPKPVKKVLKVKKENSTIDEIANEVKIAISEREKEENLSSKDTIVEKEKEPKKLSEKSLKPTYVEILANESSVKKSNTSSYIQDLQNLSEEIDKERE